MIDTQTQKRIEVHTDGTAGPYIMVPVEQIDSICDLLDGAEVSYWVDEQAISLNGKPEISVINLGKGCDVEQVQGLLDQN